MVRWGPQRNGIGIVRPNALHADVSPEPARHAMAPVLGRGSDPADSKQNRRAPLTEGGGKNRWNQESQEPRIPGTIADQLLRSPSAVRFHCVTLSAIMRVDFIAAWLS